MPASVPQPTSLCNRLPLLQCTCVAVSKKWLVLGTSAGALHLIQKDGWKQRLILTHKVLRETSESTDCALALLSAYIQSMLN